MTQYPPRPIPINARTVLAPAQIDTAWDLWSRGYGTHIIAERLHLPEFAIWNCMDIIRGVRSFAVVSA